MIPEKKLPYDQEHLPTKFGTEVVMRFYRLLKGTSLYEKKNVVIDRLTRECLPVINAIIQSEGSLGFKIVRDSFFFNNTKIQVTADKYPMFKGFLQEMRQRWIGEVEFKKPLQGEQLKDFVFLLSGLETNNESNYLYVMKQFEYLNLNEMISIGKMEFFRDEEIFVDSEDLKQQSKEVYFKSINLVKEISESVKNQKMLNIRKAKRLMQNAVNVIMQDESTLLGLANIKNYDEYTFNHCVNVAMYSIALGQRIGIPRKNLSHLGMAGLFHDVGKVRIPKEILNKSEKLSPEEWSIMRAHPDVGAGIVMRMKEGGQLRTR